MPPQPDPERPRVPRLTLPRFGRFASTLVATVAVAATLGVIAGAAVTSPDSFVGGDGADVQQGSPESDAMDGGGSSDFLRGLAGADDLDGGSGEDALIGDEGTATDCCADSLDGGSGNDEVAGGAGDDELIGGDGDDRLGSLDLTEIGGVNAVEEGNDSLSAGSGDDVVEAGPGGDAVAGGSGHDVITSGPANESGADTITEGPGSDTIDGGGGVDTVDYRAFATPITMSADTSSPLSRHILNSGDDDRIVRVEKVVGSDLQDAGDDLLGLGAEDTLMGLGGPDTLSGGASPDRLEGGDGDDVLNGGATRSRPTCTGGGLTGQPQVCTFIPDELVGGDGVDTASYVDSPDEVTASVATGTATGDGPAPGVGEGPDTLAGIENLTGSAHSDDLTGSDGPNTLHGGSGGDDELKGGGGADRLRVRDGAGGDSADCGDGAGDVAEVDPGDSTIGCETVDDGTPPAAPSALVTAPASPSNEGSPRLKGELGSGNPTQVRVYLNGTCAGDPAATGSDAEFTASGIAVTVPADATSTLSAKAVNANGASPCSGSLSYTEDSTAPAAPSITGFDPASPANDNSPAVKGSASGSIVKLYKSNDCSGTVAASGTPAEFTAGLTVSVPDNSTTPFTATATDAAGNTSGCSAAASYVENSTPPPPPVPAAPTALATSPASPSNANSPRVKGSLGSGSPTQVRVYLNGNCSGTPAATGTAAEFTGTGITVTVPANQTSTLSASAVNAGGASPCSASIAYLEDSVAPSAPSIDAFVPASPANDDTPLAKGSAPANTTVRLYKSSTCLGAAVATGTAAQFASGIEVTVQTDTTTPFAATATDQAGNASGCSAAASYTEDSTAPAAPTLSALTPASPANDNSPKLKGSAEAGASVRLYRSADCSGPVIASPSPAALAAGVTVPVADDTTTSLSARAADAAGNVSPCSVALTYVEDSTGPAVPSLEVVPASPADDNNPKVKGSAAGAVTVRLYKSADCSGTVAATASPGQLAAGVAVPVPDNSTTTFTATALDAAGNPSGCSAPVSYTEQTSSPGPEPGTDPDTDPGPGPGPGAAPGPSQPAGDTVPPPTPTITGTSPRSRSNSNKPKLRGRAEAGSTVTIFKGKSCAGTPAASGTAAAFAKPGIRVKVRDNSSTFFTARATDAAGNASGCSTPRRYVEKTPKCKKGSGKSKKCKKAAPARRPSTGIGGWMT